MIRVGRLPDGKLQFRHTHPKIRDKKGNGRTVQVGIKRRDAHPDRIELDLEILLALRPENTRAANAIINIICFDAFEIYFRSVYPKMDLRKAYSRARKSFREAYAEFPRNDFRAKVITDAFIGYTLMAMYLYELEVRKTFSFEQRKQIVRRVVNRAILDSEYYDSFVKMSADYMEHIRPLLHAVLLRNKSIDVLFS